jgi:hypothetical protein
MHNTRTDCQGRLVHRPACLLDMAATYRQWLGTAAAMCCKWTVSQQQVKC